MKKFLCSTLLVAIAIMLAIIPSFKPAIVHALPNENHVRSAVLIERSTGKVLEEKDAHSRHPIASVTKLMTVLLTLENLDTGNITLDDKVLVSENASGMGGSQVFLDANCEYDLSELLKSVIVASANDSSVALAEHIAGSTTNFVRMMNERAAELGLNDTNYANCTGLPSPDGYSSAYDQAIVLNKVLNYPTYHEYSSIWMQDFVHPSGRITQMTNTNKLSRFYSGCIGGKTGSTNEAKYCLAVGAERNNMGLIAVVLGADTSKERFNTASELLSYGFANFSATKLFSYDMLNDKTIAIKGQNRTTSLAAEREFSLITKNGEQPNYSVKFNLPDMLTSVNKGDVVGNVEIIVDGVKVDTINIYSTQTHKESTLLDYIKQITQK